MPATIDSTPLFVRTTTAVLTIVQSGLMLAGIVLLLGLFALSQGDRRVVEHLSVLLPEGGEGAFLMADPAAPADEDLAVDAAAGPLSPRMRAALESVSRRYRVSMGPLEPIFSAAESAGREFGLDPLLIVSVIAVESRFNPFSESVMGAQGLMQVIPRFHQDKLPEGAGGLSFFDPVLNVQIGTRILKDSIHRNGGLVPGLQQFAGATEDAEQRYAAKVLAEKARLEAAAQRGRLRNA